MTLLYRELATINKVIGLSPESALDRAEIFLAQQGYSTLVRTDTSLTVKRDEPDYPIEEGVLALKVVALAQPEGGVRVKIRGNDQEGMRKRQAEWREWVESLPGRRSGEPDSETAPLSETEDQSQFDDPEKNGSNVLREEEFGREASDPQHNSEVQFPTIKEEHMEEVSSQKEAFEVPEVLEEERTEEANSQKEAFELSEVSPGPRSTPQLYEYKMVQLPPPLPPPLDAHEEDHQGDKAARYLQSVANEQAEQGWEFYRVDALGDRLRQRQYFVATFRRPRQEPN